MTEAQQGVEDRSFEIYSVGSKITDKIVSGAWEGSPCFLIGGGPSLREFDFSKLVFHRTIGINKSFLFHPSNIVYFMDHLFYNEMYGKRPQDVVAWEKFSGIKCTPAPYSEKQKYHSDISLVRRRFSPTVSRSLEEGIYVGSNSGIGALMLAIALKASPIYLLGYDLAIKENTHWHEGYGEGLADMAIRMREYLHDFKVLAPLIKEAGVRVVNLNPASALKEFEFGDVKEVLG